MKRDATTISGSSGHTSKAVIFTRVSSKDQEEGHSLNAKLKRLQEYCKRHNFDVVREFEVSESSTIGDRKNFHEMINFVKSESKKTKNTVVLVVDSINRLQRGFKESALIDEPRKDKIIEIHFIVTRFILKNIINDINITINLL
jgi:site-specific DNA recombinase